MVVSSIEDEETVVVAVLIEVVYIVIDESAKRLCRKHNFILRIYTRSIHTLQYYVYVFGPLHNMQMQEIPMIKHVY